jgi:RND family efflux transporter MFP subunit
MEPAVEVKLSSPVSGIIKSIRADRGKAVSENDVLVTLDATAEQAAVELARAKLEFGQRKVQRTEELFRDNFTSAYSVDEAVTEARLAQVELAQARTILGQKTLRSPISGIVVDKIAEVGEFVSDDEILRIANLNPLYIEVILPVEDWNRIQNGMKAIVRPQEPVGGEYEAVVRVVDRVVDAASATFGVRLSMPNPKNKLPAGLRCTVTFPDA